MPHLKHQLRRNRQLPNSPVKSFLIICSLLCTIPMAGEIDERATKTDGRTAKNDDRSGLYNGPTQDRISRKVISDYESLLQNGRKRAPKAVLAELKRNYRYQKRVGVGLLATGIVSLTLVPLSATGFAFSYGDATALGLVVFTTVFGLAATSGGAVALSRNKRCLRRLESASASSGAALTGIGPTVFSNEVIVWPSELLYSVDRTNSFFG